MPSTALTLAIMFATGVAFGSTVCNLTCGPLILVRMGSRGRGWKDGTIMAFVYSLPRMAILTAFGSVVGAGGHVAAGSASDRAVVLIQVLVYLLIGTMMIMNGLRFVRGRIACGDRPTDRLIRRLAPVLPGSERAYMLSLGLLFSLVCMGEAWGLLGLASVDAALSGSTVLISSILGGAYMLAFSIGLSFPPIVMAAFISEAGRRYDVSGLVRAGGYVLMVIGVAIILFEVLALLTLLT